MKLQPKRKIQAELAAQKKAQIDEGLTLAKKVDALRETKVLEEGNLRRFRQESVSQVQAEINRKLIEKSQVLAEIKVLEKERDRLLIPLDAQWQELREAKKSLIAWKQELESYDAHVAERENELAQEEKEIALERDRIDILKEQTAVALADAKQVLAHAQLQAAKSTEESEQRIAKVVSSETMLAAKNIELANVAALQLAKESALVQLKKEITEEKATLHIPIEKEWQEIAQAKKRIQEEIEQLSARELHSKETEFSLRMRDQKLTESYAELGDRERQAEEKLGKMSIAYQELTQAVESLEEKEKDITLAIKKEQTQQMTQRERFIAEITALSEEKERLLIPLDAAWSEVRKKEQFSTLLSERLAKKEMLLVQKAIALAQEKEQLKQLMEETLHNHLRASENAAIQEEAAKQARHMLATVKKQSNDTLSELARKIDEITRRESSIAIREYDLEKLSAHLMDIEKDLSNRERALVDKYQTLERTITRLKK